MFTRFTAVRKFTEKSAARVTLKGRDKKKKQRLLTEAVAWEFSQGQLHSLINKTAFEKKAEQCINLFSKLAADHNSWFRTIFTDKH